MHFFVACEGFNQDTVFTETDANLNKSTTIDNISPQLLRPSHGFWGTWKKAFILGLFFFWGGGGQRNTDNIGEQGTEENNF